MSITSGSNSERAESLPDLRKGNLSVIHEIPVQDVLFEVGSMIDLTDSCQPESYLDD